MIHYSCDRCKRRIDTKKELRHVVRVETQTVLDPLSEDDPDEDRDHLLEIDELLDGFERDEADSLADDLAQQLRFDLCAECYRKYLRNPLGMATPLRVGFGPN